jgi:hypothetical protein
VIPLYRQISEISAEPLPVDIARPHTWLQPTTAREPNGKEFDLPRYERHLLCDEDGTSTRVRQAVQELNRAVLAALDGLSEGKAA